VTRTATALILSAAALAGCGSSAATTSAVSAAQPSASMGITQAQGTRICNDFLAWLKQADNEGAPRFNQALLTDESAASGTLLGSALDQMQSDVDTNNSLALSGGGLGGLGDVVSACQGYGVMVPLYPSLPLLRLNERLARHAAPSGPAACVEHRRLTGGAPWSASR
jgi:hypothetical protein